MLIATIAAFIAVIFIFAASSSSSLPLMSPSMSFSPPR